MVVAKVAACAKRLVEGAIVEKSVVVVAFVKSVVEARSVPPWSVVNDEEAEEMNPLVKVWSWLQVLVVVVPKAMEKALLAAEVVRTNGYVAASEDVAKVDLLLKFVQSPLVR